ncbi:MAG TPA: NrfD/PsrC family molybdoenzyme membrane anchor subunit, partial [Roseiflexaceae bacterium]|nr:NrfD/PsrC family molybdoenzyme membrane anchor subunit [Roseiflexaceae bacterium]
MQTEQHRTPAIGATNTTTAATEKPGYYGMPVLKRPHWKWEIILYFWMGGIAVGAYVTAAIADLFGDQEDDILARTGRLIALPLMVLSPILLIKDLGRPEKFYNMLRVVKLRSPMSVGTWVLTTFGAFSGLSALLELFFYEPRWRWLRRLTAILGTPGAIAVGGYTGILLSATAIPLWFKNRLMWGPVFLASAFSTGTAAI